MAAVYFADTFWWIAIASPKDAWHARVLAWEAAHPQARFVTTEEILSELLTWFAGTGSAGRTHASAVVRGILGDPSAQVLPQTSADFAAALALYEARPDKGYSLTDCRSMLALRTLGIADVLTNDQSLHPGRVHDPVSRPITECYRTPQRAVFCPLLAAADRR
jgi:predicted nucleic acid-binding protein